jgi:hypothetical protein
LHLLLCPFHILTDCSRPCYLNFDLLRAPPSPHQARDTVSAQWSPCGRYFLTATTSPRLRVDNGLKVGPCRFLTFYCPPRGSFIKYNFHVTHNPHCKRPFVSSVARSSSALHVRGSTRKA